MTSYALITHTVLLTDLRPMSANRIWQAEWHCLEMFKMPLSIRARHLELNLLYNEQISKRSKHPGDDMFWYGEKKSFLALIGITTTVFLVLN